MKRILLLLSFLSLSCVIMSQTFPDKESVKTFINDSIVPNRALKASTIQKAYNAVVKFLPEIGDTSDVSPKAHGMIFYHRADSTFYVYDTILNPDRWVPQRTGPGGAGGGGYTTLSQFVGETAWRSFYSNGSGDVTPLAFGTAGKYFRTNGASSAPTWESIAQSEVTGLADSLLNKVTRTGSYANPAFISSLAWSKITGTPTVLSGYGISDTKANFNTALSDGDFVFTSDTVNKYPRVIAGTNVTITGSFPNQIINSSGGSTSNTPTVNGEYKGATQGDRLLYDGFTSHGWTDKRDTIFMAWKSSGNHVADGPLMYTYSIDGGSSWINIDTLKVDGSNVSGGTVEIGMLNNRLAVCYTVGPTYARVRFAYNDARDINFTGVDSVAATALQGKVAPFGAIVKMPSGKCMFPAYSWNISSDTTTSFFYQTTDNGATWTVGDNILKSDVSTGFPQGSINETSAIRVEDTATSDANAKLMAVIRNETYTGYHLMCYSNDGGSTWTNTGASQTAWAFGASNSTVDAHFPANLILDGSTIYAIVCRRGSNQDYSTRVFKQAASSYATANAWDVVNAKSYSTIYRALDAYKGGDVDFGYARPFINKMGELKASIYDISISDKILGSATYTKVFTIPARGGNYFQSFANANQSITTATETTVTASYVWLDSERGYNADTAAYTIPEDGMWEIEATLMPDTSSAGTYRQAKLYAIDPGATFGAYAVRGYYVLDKKILPPSTIADFNYIKLKAIRYLHKGMRLRLTFKHDVGSSINLLSSTSPIYQLDENRVLLTAKKIN